MTHVIRAEGETIDQLVRRFKNKVQQSGVLGDFRWRLAFISEPDRRRLKSKTATARRARGKRGKGR